MLKLSHQAIKDWRDEGDALRKAIAAQGKELELREEVVALREALERQQEEIELREQEKMDLVDQIIARAKLEGYVEEEVMAKMFAKALLDCREDEHRTKVLTEIFVDQLQGLGYQWDQIPAILAVASEKLLNYIKEAEQRG